jgi:hypothetical protein
LKKEKIMKLPKPVNWVRLLKAGWHSILPSGRIISPCGGKLD